MRKCAESKKASRNKLKVTTPKDREIKIERTFDGPLELVWRALADPELLSQWWGRGNRLDVRMEFKVGGHWRFVEHGPDGEQGFEGRYREIVPRRKIVETFEWDGMPGYVSIQSTVLKKISKNKTKIVSNALFFTNEERDGMLQSGMEHGLDQSYKVLDRLLQCMKDESSP